jgi:hypothetical protein
MDVVLTEASCDDADRVWTVWSRQQAAGLLARVGTGADLPVLCACNKQPCLSADLVIHA